MSGRSPAPPTTWRLMGASVQGTRHAGAGVGCEDAFASNVAGQRSTARPAGPAVIAVCDGAGSRARAAEGAVLAARLAVTTFEEQFCTRQAVDSPDGWHDYLTQSLRLLISGFERVAAAVAGHDGRRDRSTVDDFATTLVVAVLAPPWVGLVSVGDGFVVTRARVGGEDHFHLVVPPDPTGAHAGETTFLTSGASSSSARVWSFWDPALSGVAVSTDGLVDVALELDGSLPVRAHPEFFRRWFEWADDPDFASENLARFLASELVCRHTTDDKTLVLAVPAPR